jgi:hypothetical protein
LLNVLRLTIVVGVTLSIVAPTGIPETTTLSFRACDCQLEMQHRTGVGLNNHVLLHLLKALRRDRDRVIPDGYRTEFKFSVALESWDCVQSEF